MPISPADARNHALKFLGLMMTNHEILKQVQDIPVEVAGIKTGKNWAAIGKVMEQHLGTGPLTHDDVANIAHHVQAETSRLSGMVRGHAPEVADALDNLGPPMS